ncbi:MAG: OsmC family protein [Spirochaetales bacterium]|nr:OsmC family protein [Spirochaetales bacterium]
MEHTSSVTFTGGMSFDVEADGHHFAVDADEQFGGKDLGPKPKKLLLSALAGCTGMDVVLILTKMRMPFDKFWLEVSAELDELQEPAVYTAFRIRYCFTGTELDREKIEKAVNLSEEKYCGVSAMFKSFASVSTEIILNPKLMEK